MQYFAAGSCKLSNFWVYEVENKSALPAAALASTGRARPRSTVQGTTSPEARRVEVRIGSDALGALEHRIKILMQYSFLQTIPPT